MFPAHYLVLSAGAVTMNCVYFQLDDLAGLETGVVGIKIWKSET